MKAVVIGKKALFSLERYGLKMTGSRHFSYPMMNIQLNVL